MESEFCLVDVVVAAGDFSHVAVVHVDVCAFNVCGDGDDSRATGGFCFFV